MTIMILCAYLLAFHLALRFFVMIFSSCMHYPYYAFMKGTGLQIGFFSYTWTTTAFNRLIFRWSKNLTPLLPKWYTYGYLITIWLFLPFSLWTLLTIIFENFYESIQVSKVEVKAMIPGINIPTSDICVYLISITISSVVHELGHALAAVQEDVQLLSVGFCIFTVVPVAFVNLNSEHVNNLPVTKRLKIYCAGVWHNLATAFIALLLFFASPIIFNIGYETGVGVKIVDFTHDSPLKEARGLDKGDVVTSINGCDVKNLYDWLYCLQMAHERFGICTSAEFVAQNDEIMMETIKDDVVECCRKDDLYSFCFEYMEPKVAGDSVLPGQYSCLRPRDMVTDNFSKCTEASGYSCSKSMHCLKPSLNNHTYLMIIERKDNNAVLYLGLPYDLHKTVFVDQYFPRIALFSFFSPLQFEKLLRYVFIFSMGFGFVNIVPCYGFDGHHIARNLITLLAKYLNKNGDFITFFTVLTIFVGTGVTGPIMLYLFYKAYELDFM